MSSFEGVVAATAPINDPAGVNYYDNESEPSSGWLFFAGSILGLAGIMRIVDAIWAFRYHGALPENLDDGILGSDLKSYAWLYLVVGVILLISSFLVLKRSQFARWIGMIAAAIGAVSALALMPYYPVWALVYIGLAVLVLYGLAAHGGRLQT
jgi:hypothetical protein